MASDNRNSHASRWATSTPNNPPAPPRLSVADQLMQDASASAFVSQAKPLVDRLGSTMFDRVAPVLFDMHQKLAANELNGNLSASGRGAGETEIRRAALEAIEPVWADAQSTVAKLEDLVDEATMPPSLDPQSALLQELQIGRSWDRVVRRLDAADHSDYAKLTRIIQNFAKAAAEARDRPMLLALSAELPDYLTSIGVAGLYGHGGLEQLLDEVEMPFLPAKARAARQVERQARDGWQRLVEAFRMARANASTGDGLGILPGWAQNETINIKATL